MEVLEGITKRGLQITCGVAGNNNSDCDVKERKIWLKSGAVQSSLNFDWFSDVSEPSEIPAMRELPSATLRNLAKKKALQTLAIEL
ncbi:hypothetical protein H9L39_05029 [Fusarium oxysporum f. sp. albedinis]|nr:hypothetical protein H9L39_05029 [Fusarium oxysporum f. sp. albedinis]